MSSANSKGVLDLTFLDLNQYESGLIVQIQQQQQIAKNNASADSPTSPTSKKINEIINANKTYINEDLDNLLRERYELTIQNEKSRLSGTNVSFNSTASSLECTKEVSFEDKPIKSTKRRNRIKAIRIANNNLKYFEFILYSLTRLELIDPNEILWIDASFNFIENVPSISLIQLFPNLTTIYLQANKISNLSSTKVFKQLTQLKSISLFGNPIEEMKHYRNYVLHHCPMAVQLDNCVVTKLDRTKVS